LRIRDSEADTKTDTEITTPRLFGTA